MTNESHNPQAVYEARLAQLRAACVAHEKRFDHIANARLAVFAVALALGGAAWASDGVSWWWILLPLAAFVALLVWHERTARARTRAKAGAAFYERGLRRMAGDWPGDGNQSTDRLEEDHGYALDLDLFGEASLFELLCQAKTEAGERHLADWLQQPQKREDILARQAAVQELTGRVALREDLGLLGAAVRKSVQGESLSRWAVKPTILPQNGLRTLFLVLTGLAVLFLILGISVGFYAPLVVIFGVQLVLLRTLARPILQVVQEVEEPTRELRVLALLLERLEQEKFEGSLLRDIHTRLMEAQQPVSQRIKQLERLVFLFDLHLNQLFAPIAILLMWGVHLAFAIESWRVRWGQHVPKWLDAVGELEALLSLSAFAYEHPDYPYPDIMTGPSHLEGTALEHPLLKPGASVANDVRLGDGLKVTIVSGSNMSGKSTYLRVVGINVVLAQLGLSVCAKSLQLTPFRIGATLRVQDSIQGGISRFYAELKRLKSVSGAIDDESPVLFLLDEILHGTNSHDRQIGAEALVKSFVARGAVGFVTTHDLALTKAADAMGNTAANVHFSDTLEGGELRFDYTMRAGVVDHSNALQLMANLGLLPGIENLE
ncbi:MAG: DNA mismatch repair protein MutS [Candidatus Hydrogenedentes bacterium]|nr:DNA mismatch repair protein MutS [Candidatus Hydrogenedentota bacterium]